MFTDNASSTTSVLVAAAARVVVAASTGNCTPIIRNYSSGENRVCERENSETINITPRSEQIGQFSDNEQQQQQQEQQTHQQLLEHVQYNHRDALPMDSYLLTDREQRVLNNLEDCLSFGYDSIDVPNHTLCKLACMILSNTSFYLPATQYYNARPITPDLSL